jgi:DNA-binding winged helix-turn-helix (wHTH) protein
MGVEPGFERHRIGGWDFLPATGELRRRSDVRRLEPRAAKALQLLCEANGNIVTHEQLIERVWNGRALSENSLAVVVGQLRRALDDDAREPRLIETIPKRGYRLVEAVPPSRAARRPVWPWLAVLAIGLLLAWGTLLNRSGGREVSMADVANQTGEQRYDALARATSELIVAELSKRGFDVHRGGTDGVRLESKLVMWNGAPYLGLSATDESGIVRWSAMTRGTPDAVPKGVAAELDEFSAKFTGR